MLTYLLKVLLCSAAFYLIYHLLLRRETFFRLNRWYLLGTTILSLIIPAIELNWQATQAPVAVYYLQPVTVGVEQLETVISAASAKDQAFDFWTLLTWAYGAGVALALARFGYGLFQIFRLYRVAEVVPVKGYRFVSTHAPHVPFSFFKNLFWSIKFKVSETDRQSIIRHEEAHIFQWHSLDVILFELAGVFLWFNPFIYLYKNAMKTTHEYLADAYVTAGFSKKQYGRLLLRQSQPEGRLPHRQIAISNSLFSSQLKQRIVMMTKNKSSQWASLKYLAALPVLAMFFLAFSTIEKQEATTAAFTWLPEFTPGKVVHVPVSIVETNQPKPTRPARQTMADTLPEGEVFNVVDEMPRFPGCEEMTDPAERDKCAQTKLMEFIFKNIKYPETARKNGIQGMSVVKFIVEKDGSISEAEIVRRISGECDEEVLRIVYMMPKWVPGKQKGKAVRTQFMLPVRFQLNPEDKKAATDAVKEADQMPRFAGCESAENKDACASEKLFKFIADNMKYPEEARKAGVEGMAVVKFIVGEDGAVSDVGVLKSLNTLCDEEAMRVVRAMPNWTPGMKDGKAVAVQMALPFKYALSKEMKETSSVKAEVFDVYPNPSGENGFYVKYKTEPGQMVIRLTDTSGKFLKEVPVNNYDGSLQTSHLTGIFEKTATKSNVVVSLYLDGKLVESRTVVMQ